MPVTYYGATVQNFSATSLLVKILGVNTLLVETDLTVGLVLVNVFTALANTTYMAFLRNTSVTQNIRVGVAPNFGAPAGILLAPGNSIVFDFWGMSINAIADAAAGTLNRFVVGVT